MALELDSNTSSGRRKFLIQSTVSLVAASLSPLTNASTNKIANIKTTEKHLSFIHLHTNETLQCCYWKNGQYDVVALNKINQLLRDHRTNEIAAIDHQLIDMLHKLRTTTDSSAPFEIISGYRSAKTNENLRKNTTGVAKRSYHMQGKAIDVRLADVNLKILRNTAIELQSGGVGYYSKSGFLHLDTGNPRNW